MEMLVSIIHIAVALFMILVVLVQGGNQGGISAAFGGGNTQGVFGAAGATTFLGKLTYGAALIFMATSISLTILEGKGGEVGLSEKLQRQGLMDRQQSTEASPAAAKPQAEQAEPAAEPDEASRAPAGE